MLNAASKRPRTTSRLPRVLQLAVVQLEVIRPHLAAFRLPKVPLIQIKIMNTTKRMYQNARRPMQ